MLTTLPTRMAHIYRHALLCFSFRRFLKKLPFPSLPFAGYPSLGFRTKRALTTISPQFERIPLAILVEEEELPKYKAEHYYPAKLGQIFNQRYKIIGKLGYGAASTVWLCRDLQKHDCWVALKIYINASKVHRELPVYQHINSIQSSHPGKNHVRELFSHFEIEGPHGKHICLVHKPLGLTLDELKDEMEAKVVSKEVLIELFRYVLQGLEFLHEEAKVIHTDLQPHNMFLGVHNNKIFEEFEYGERRCPAPRKELADRTIYISRPMRVTSGLVQISDLSEARFGDSENTDVVMPDVYRAPEVILGMNWSYPVDIWGLAMVVCLSHKCICVDPC